ncbi:hypothetical protein NAP1_03700 [Erythrobacter sp. NAP1]|uniref:matrixin family metalloprotease n=1 Tax=Erythrobacter sp. NAP1 TaxID=237727 RepID=UPI0000686F46|nr:matrixin family metalloprotease [Erythrobacter sp. NAP1]EAQ29846.1 hypothetical protein NAP1_03700 [Erythrobacter sp. NAP1]
MRISMIAIGSIVLVSGCSEQQESATDESLVNVSSVAEREASREASLSAVVEGFEEFRASTYREPFDGGGYIVSGDIHLATDADLREFYEKWLVQSAANDLTNDIPETEEEFAVDSAAFTIGTVHGYNDVWPDDQKVRLTYCVSSTFEDDYGRVLDAMAAAASRWEQFAEVDFIHTVEEDQDCDRLNSSVVFDVRPVDVAGEYLARAFFPSYARGSRNVLIDASAMVHPNEGNGLTLTGILRHELGHVLGARHEHVRPQAGACFEDSDWRPVTDYDPYSVMHYPQCNGLGDWTLTLTELDQNGVACVYGAAPNFSHNPGLCQSILPQRGG